MHAAPRFTAWAAAVALVGLVGGCGLWLGGPHRAAEVTWGVTTAIGVVPATAWVVVSFIRRRPGVDLIAVLALGGALAVGEYFAGAVISVMLATGRLLEARASRRAERELRSLLDRTPRVVHRFQDDTLTDPPLEAVVPGDLLLVRSGEVVPVDGRLVSAVALLDESALTGEALPVRRSAGEAIASGVVNADAPFQLRAMTSAAESTYAGVVRLVEAARADRAPFARLADRYAAWFLPFACTAALAAWLVSGDPARAVAVLVVATPCPLILAAPVALVSGVSRAARRGVVVKGGRALEQLARGRVLLLDKTGTITRGQPAVTEVIVADQRKHPPQEVLRVAGSLDQFSPHVLASAIVREAHRRGIGLAVPESVEEVPGSGVRGIVEAHRVTVGKAGLAGDGRPSEWVESVQRRAALDSSIAVFVGIDGEPAGVLLLDDPIRTDAARTIRALRRSGLERVVMVTGDRTDVAEAVAAIADVDDVYAERSPADKVEVVRFERRNGPTIMVGDGINDAPALAAADLGVAVAASGGTASSEAADAMLVVDRLDRVGDAVRIAHRALRIATQSVLVGMGLSMVAMGVAAIGWLPATLGALLQEGIDVAVLLNALRVVTGPSEQLRLEHGDAALGRRFSDEHPRLQAELERLRSAADMLGSDRDEALAQVRAVHAFLVDELLPHEQAEDAELYPVLERVLGGYDSTGAMSRAHAEIAHLVRRLGRLLDAVPDDGPRADDIRELQRVLYGLHAILRLHFAQEDEGYFSLLDAEEPRADDHILDPPPVRCGTLKR